MKPRHLGLGVALLVAAGVAVFGDKTPDSGVAEAVQRGAAPARPAAPAVAKGGAEPAIVALKPRAQLIGDSAAGDGANLFLSQDWTPPPPPQPLVQPAAAAPPVAPPLPFTYLGKAVGEGAWEVFLARSGQTYVVRNKMVIDGVYRVDAIAPPVMTLTYLPLNQVQQLNIGVLD
jgi:hypothetical protein